MEFALGVIIFVLILGTSVCFGLLIWPAVRALFVWHHKKSHRQPKPVSFEKDSWYKDRAPRNVVSVGKPNPFVAERVRTATRSAPYQTTAFRQEVDPVQTTDDGPDFLSTFVAAEIASSVFDSSPSTDYSAPDTSSSDSFSFGGGDSGGGGASGDW